MKPQEGFDFRGDGEKRIVLEVALVLSAHVNDEKKAKELAERVVELVKKRLGAKQ